MRLLILMAVSLWSFASSAVNCPGTYYRNLNIRGYTYQDMSARADEYCREHFSRTSHWAAMYYDVNDAQGNYVKDTEGNYLIWLEDVFCSESAPRNDLKYRKYVIQDRDRRGEHLNRESDDPLNVDTILARPGPECTGVEPVDAQQSSDAAPPHRTAKARRAPSAASKAKSH